MSEKFAPHFTDAYKLGHKSMYPDGQEYLYSSFTPRGAKHFDGGPHYDNKLSVVGLYAIFTEIRNLWDEHFFNVPSEVVWQRYTKRCDGILSNKLDITHMMDLHELGYLPLEIRAIDEGVRLPIGIPVFTITNTVQGFGWLVNYLETQLSSYAWKPLTTATIAYEYRRNLVEAMKKYGGEPALIPILCHDFSMRGLTPEDAARSGIGHLSAFMGTDTVCAIDYVDYYYGMSNDQEPIGVSVPASEHSVSSSNILNIIRILKKEGSYKGMTREEVIQKIGSDDEKLIAEYLFALDYINKFPSGIVSYVADTYDFWGFVEKILPALHSEIMGRTEDSLGLSKFVVRPDSGDPVDILCGTIPVAGTNGYDLMNTLYFNHINQYTNIGDMVDGEYYAMVDRRYVKYSATHKTVRDGLVLNAVNIDETSIKVVTIDEVPVEKLGLIAALYCTFGGTINPHNGQITLNSKIGAIYGDSITLKRQREILDKLGSMGFTADNVVYGIGSYTYQMVSRDTFGFAMKATGCVVDGEEIMLFKDPKTDPGKKSAKGWMRVHKDDIGEYVLVDQLSKAESEKDNELKLLFRDGNFFGSQPTFDTIRRRLEETL